MVSSLNLDIMVRNSFSRRDNDAADDVGLWLLLLLGLMVIASWLLLFDDVTWRGAKVVVAVRCSEGSSKVSYDSFIFVLENGKEIGCVKQDA